MTTGISSFDKTVQKSHIWLNEIMEELGWDDKQDAYHALRGVLQTLRDRLTVDEAVQLGSQLPMLIRGIYYEGWNPTDAPKKMNKAEFKLNVLHEFRQNLRRGENVDEEEVIAAVFTVLNRHVDKGEVEDVRKMLPNSVRKMLPRKAAT